jgi:hypothetical protein
MTDLSVYSGNRQLTDTMSGRDRFKKFTLEELVHRARNQLDLVELGGTGNREVRVSGGPAELNHGMELFARDHDTGGT